MGLLLHRTLRHVVAEPFVHRLRVRYGECDAQGVVFNAHYLAYFDVLMTELWRERLGSYDAMLRTGVDMVVAQVGVRFHHPARFDDELDLRATISRMGTTAMTTAIDVLRGPDLLAEGELRHVFVAADGSGKTAIPQTIREGLARHVAPAI